MMSMGCSSFVRNTNQRLVTQRGQLLRQWKVDDQDRTLVREGNRVVEYRLVQYQVGPFVGGDAEVVYAVDTVIHTCYTGSGSQLRGTPNWLQVDCAMLALDPDMKPYITWVSPLGEGQVSEKAREVTAPAQAANPG
jgi:hypothetical protein